MHKLLLACMSKLLSSGEMGRMVDCVCTYVCRTGLLLKFFLQSFQMVFSSVHLEHNRTLNSNNVKVGYIKYFEYDCFACNNANIRDMFHFMLRCNAYSSILTVSIGIKLGSKV